MAGVWPRKDAHTVLISEIRAASEDVGVRPTSEGFADLAYALNLRGSLVVAEATILGAIERRETRGAHNRFDYPYLKVNFIKSLGEDGKFSMQREQVHTVPEYLEEWAKEAEAGKEYQVAGRLVE